MSGRVHRLGEKRDTLWKGTSYTNLSTGMVGVALFGFNGVETCRGLGFSSEYASPRERELGEKRKEWNNGPREEVKI